MDNIFKYHVFVSYNDLEINDATILKSYLKNSGFKTFFAADSLKAGVNWVTFINEAIEASDCLLLLLGKDGLGDWQKQELELFQIISAKDKSRTIIPIILPSLIDDFTPAHLPNFLKSIHAFSFKNLSEVEIFSLFEAIPRNFSLISDFERPFLENEQNKLMEDTIAFYNKNAQLYFNKWNEFIPKSLIEFNQYLIENYGEVKILDVGCGPGHHSKFLAKNGHEVTGIDYCNNFIELAKVEKLTNCEFVYLDMRKLYKYFLNRNLFDAIWACASLFHLSREHLSNILYQFIALLKPGGLLSVSLQVNMPSNIQEDGRFFERYEVKDLERIFREHGFELISKQLDETDLNTLDKKQLKVWGSFTLKVPINKERLMIENKNYT